MKNEFLAYYKWCLFLHRVPKEKWSAKVKGDFDGLDLCTTNRDVAKWLMEHRSLFNGPVPGRVFPRHYKEGDEQNPENICITINIRTADSDIYGRIASYLSSAREEIGVTKAPGRPEFVARAGTYRLAGRPDLNGLDICLTVLDVLNQHPELSKREVGEKIAAQYPLAVKLKLQGRSSERDKVMSSLGSRYVKKAEAILEGVARGVFPAA